MTDSARLLLSLGVIYLLALIGDWIGRHTPVPRVALLIGTGFLLGPEGLAVMPEEAKAVFPLIADIALVMVGFLIGGALTRRAVRENGVVVLVTSLSTTIVTFLVVLLGLGTAGFGWVVSALLAAAATATDPAATMDIVRGSGAKGALSSTLPGIVALDDAWGLAAFSLALVFVDLLLGQHGAGEALAAGARDLIGGLLVGLAVGAPMAYLTGRIRPGEPTQTEALGMVLLCGGLALWAEVSFILASISMGVVVANLAKHHRRPFHAIEGIEWPFLVVFFVLAGASVDLEQVAVGGWLLVGYLGLRVAGRFGGGLLGGRLARMPARTSSWLGLALLPQAGVAVGMTMVGSQRYPEAGELVLPVVLAGTVLFELLGPVLTRLALSRCDELPRSLPQ